MLASPLPVNPPLSSILWFPQTTTTSTIRHRRPTVVIMDQDEECSTHSSNLHLKGTPFENTQRAHTASIVKDAARHLPYPLVMNAEDHGFRPRPHIARDDASVPSSPSSSRPSSMQYSPNQYPYSILPVAAGHDTEVTGWTSIAPRRESHSRSGQSATLNQYSSSSWDDATHRSFGDNQQYRDRVFAIATGRSVARPSRETDAQYPWSPAPSAQPLDESHKSYMPHLHSVPAYETLPLYSHMPPPVSPTVPLSQLSVSERHIPPSMVGAWTSTHPSAEVQIKAAASAQDGAHTVRLVRDLLRRASPPPLPSGENKLDSTLHPSSSTSANERGSAPVRKRRRPPFSYSTLIAQAISSSPESKMTLREIYSWISNAYPDLYQVDGPDSQGWQNTVRHNLSLNKTFVKVPRTSGDMHEANSAPASRGKGGFWMIGPSAASVAGTIGLSRVPVAPTHTMKGADMGISGASADLRGELRSESSRSSASSSSPGNSLPGSGYLNETPRLLASHPAAFPAMQSGTGRPRTRTLNSISTSPSSSDALRPATSDPALQSPIQDFSTILSVPTPSVRGGALGLTMRGRSRGYTTGAADYMRMSAARFDAEEAQPDIDEMVMRHRRPSISSSPYLRPLTSSRSASSPRFRQLERLPPPYAGNRPPHATLPPSLALRSMPTSLLSDGAHQGALSAVGPSVEDMIIDQNSRDPTSERSEPEAPHLTSRMSISGLLNN